MAVGYNFPILNSDGSTSTTIEDLEDMFVRKDQFLTSGLWSWGENANGPLGLGDIVHRSSPVQLGSLTTWRYASRGLSHSLFLKTDGTLWGAGLNSSGQLGLGDITHRSSPVQVGALTNWKFVAAGTNFSTAIKTDGTLWSWGLNTFGNLGLSDTASRSSPVQVGILNIWRSIAVGGTSQSYAITTNNTLWSWGHNAFYGALGLNDLLHRSSPVQVGSLTDWKLISVGTYHAATIKVDGSLWTWGYGALYGTLGQGTLVNKSSPVQVGSSTDWKYVGTGTRHVGAIKTDGTLWTWGQNNLGAGELGLGDQTHRSSPVQVGALTNWKQFVGMSGSSHAIKTDGTMWAWGFNSTFGQLGLGTYVLYSSPMQIGALTGWKQISAVVGGGIGISAIISPDLP